MSSNSQRLGEYVLARRAALDVTQLDVWQAGGPSNTTLSDIENGRLENLTRTTARKLDQGLGWVPGSARSVWDGGEPLAIDPEPESGAATNAELEARVIALEHILTGLFKPQEESPATVEDEKRTEGGASA